MRALMLTPDGGHLDRRIAQEANTLAGQGWAVDIYPAVDPKLDYADTLREGVRILSSVREPASIGLSRRALRMLRRHVGGALPAVDRMVEAARYSIRDRAGAIADASFAHLVSLDRYDVVFAHDVPVMPLAVRLKQAWGCGLVCDLHEVYPEQDEFFTSETARRYWRSVESVGVRAADSITCVNAAVRDYVVERYAPSVETLVVHNAVPFVEAGSLRGPTLRDYYGIGEQVRIMLFAGSLRPHKNLETLISGFSRAELDGWVLAILGEGPLAKALHEQARRESVEDVVFLGRRAPQHDLLSVAASADLGLLPYQVVGYNYLIATPNKLFEYIQARLPIATSRLPMIERIMTVHGNGDFVDFSSADAAAAGLRRMVTEVLPTITRETLEAAAHEFSWEREEPNVLSATHSAVRSGPLTGRAVR